MKSISKLILEDREKRSETVKTIIDDGFGAVVLKANIPVPKTPSGQLSLVRYYGALLNLLLNTNL